MLQPRTTGLKFILSLEYEFDAIYDLTSAYQDHIPQEETAIFKGAMPSTSHYLLKRFSFLQFRNRFETQFFNASVIMKSET